MNNQLCGDLPVGDTEFVVHELLCLYQHNQHLFPI